MPDVHATESRSEETGSSASNGRAFADWRSIAFVASLVLSCFLVYTWRFDYIYGSGDQDELLPTALSLLDGSLFTRDWLIQTVREGINVRTFFVWLMAAPGLVMPLPVSTVLLHAVVWMATAAGVYALALEITRDAIAAAFSTFLATCVTVFFAIGLNAIVSDALLPESVAWALILPGILLVLRKRWVAAGVLFGLAAWFHLLASGLTVAVLVGATLLASEQRGRSLARVVRFGATALIVSLPILIPVALGQATGVVRADLPEPLFIHAVFRNPWHHLFFSFTPGIHLRFWGLMALGIASLVWLRRRGEVEHQRMIVAIWVVSALLWVVAILFVEVWPVALIAKLQLFKTAVLAALLANVTVAAAVARTLSAGLRAWWQARVDSGWTAPLISLVAALTFAAGAATGHGPYIEPLYHPDSDLGKVEMWARNTADVDALFIVPPSASTFRSFSRRAIVADWNAFVFGDADMQTWYERLMAVAPIDTPPRGTDPREALQAAYSAHGDDDIRALQRRFGADYFVTERADQGAAFPVAFQSGEWTVRAISARTVRLTGSD